MSQSLKQFYGDEFGALDGGIGRVKDFYLDDRQWMVRYFVLDTGSWLPGRLVLIPPHAVEGICHASNCLFVKLTRQQVEDSPAISTHKPVSRQYEEKYFQYYQWPSYWEGGGMWAATGLGVAPRALFIPREQRDRPFVADESDDPHLRSAKALAGYQIQTDEGAIGHVTDFIIDDQCWAIRHLVVETGHWFWGKEIVISPKDIDRISWEEAKVFVNVTKETIMDAKEYKKPRMIYHETRESDEQKVTEANNEHRSITIAKEEI